MCALNRETLNARQVSEIMPSVLELDVALRAKGRRPQFVGSGLDSLFLAVAEQLGQLDVRIPGGDGEVRVVEGCVVRPGDAKAVKAGVLKHIEDNVAFFAKVRKETTSLNPTS